VPATPSISEVHARAFDRSYRWLLLRALRDLRGVKDTNLDDLSELVAIYNVCREQALTLAIEEGFDPSNLDLLQATSVVRSVVVALRARAG
jgi:hypothetical protein